MRSIVVSMIDEHWHHTDVPRKLTNCTEGWAYALKGEFRGLTPPPVEELGNYDLIVANLDRRMISLYAEVIHKRPKHVKWVSLIEGCGTDYLEPSASLIHVLNESDFVANINRSTTGYLQSLTTTPVAWVGVPLPYHEMEMYATPEDARREEILICPRGTKHPSILVANALGLPVTAYFPPVSRKPRNLTTFYKNRYYGKDLWLRKWERETSPVPRIPRPERNLIDTWKEAGSCRMWVNLDPRYTWARWVLDAAVFRVPIISTLSTCHAQYLFPETTVRDIFAIEEAIEIGKRILNEPEWAKQTCDRAYSMLDEFLPEACVRRMGEGLGIDLASILAAE